MLKEDLLPDVLDLGCGGHKLPGAFGVDALNLPGVDLIWDLNRFPWPLPDQAFRLIHAIDVLEHLQDMVGAVKELHRILRPGGRLKIKMPFAGGVHHHTDPTHLRGATSRTFDYFIAGTFYQKQYQYTESLFLLERFYYRREVAVGAPISWLVTLADRLLVPTAKRFHDVYENYFSGIYPMHGIFFELVKNSD